MPLDSSTFTPSLGAERQERIASRDEFWAATPHGRLRMLAFALRHMPQTHAWDFSHCYHSTKPEHRNHCGSAGCAFGLTKALWPDEEGRRPSHAHYDMPTYTFGRIFAVVGGEPLYGKSATEVTPEEVASAIDAYLVAELAKAGA